MPRRLRHLGVNVALLVASIAVTMFCLEIAVRIVRPQPLAAVARSGRIGWMHKPNSTIVYEREEFRIPVHFSSVGLRDREYALAKPPGTFRIAMLGDSFVEALQVPFDSSCAKRLEARLNATAGGGRRYEVINFGVSGYGTCQQLLQLQELVLRFEPDLVLSQFYYNDLDDDRRFDTCSLDVNHALAVREAAKLSRREQTKSAVKSFLYQHSHLWMFISTRKPRVVDLKAANRPDDRGETVKSEGPSASAVASCPGRHESLEWRLTLRDEPPDARQNVELYAAILERMQSECRAAGAGFLALLGVSKTQLEPEVYATTLAETGCRADAHDEELAATRLRDACAARHVPVVDLLPVFRAYTGPGHLHFRHDGHWTCAGHRVAAAALCDSLAGRGMLGSVRP